ncbi:MAG TPA: hypothetical protein VK327_10080, partial [Candidatus Paceibacterota bacterium]|nr:hypothetical protein [Candidatus Paceibacterota bacterium]
MNRTEKKCVIASASFHLLLVFILMFGPAFLASKSDQPIEMELVKFDPDILTDAPGQHGGTPVPVPSAPRPVPPTPAPQQTAVTPPPEPLKPVTPPKAIQKEVQKEIEKTVEPENRRDPDGFEKPKNTKPKRQIS